MTTRLVTRFDLRTALMLAAAAVIVLVVYLGTRMVFAALTPTVCVSSQMVEVGQEPVVNEMTCR